MYNTCNPIPGYWYSNNEGQLLQVRAKRYDKGVLSLIVIEGIDGARTMLDPTKWVDLSLILHSPVVDTQQTA